MVYAGFWRRALAHLIDAVILVIATSFVFIFLGFVIGFSQIATQSSSAPHAEITQIVPVSSNFVVSQAAPVTDGVNAPAPDTSAPLESATPSMEPAHEAAPPSQPQVTYPPVARESSTPGKSELSGLMVILIYAFCFGVSIAYHTFFIGSSLQATPGKRVMGCMVVTREGKRLSYLHAFGRHLACALSGLTLWIGYCLAGWTREKTALHDMIAGTRVVRVVSEPPVIATR